jgi:hypothetical protein
MKATLVIIYNHSFPNNIPKLEKYYADRFSHILHVVPFFQSSEPNVITVYEVSYMFAGHIANAWKEISSLNSDYVVFVGDDLLLNPQINEFNLESKFSLSCKSAYIDEVFSLGEVKNFWRRSVEAVSWSPSRKGIELSGDFPDSESIKSALTKNLNFSSVANRRSLMRKIQIDKNILSPHTLASVLWSVRWNIRYLRESKRKLKYPLVGGYSDLVILPREYLDKFAHLCGIFNILGLHTELAIPTILSYIFGEKLNTREKIGIKAKIEWNGNSALSPIDFNFNLSSLIRDFPIDVFYAHPIKLSKWNL